MTKTQKYIVWAAFLVLAGGGIFVWQRGYIDNAQKQRIQAENTIVDWQTYRNEEFGFEFRYPSNYSIEKGNRKFYSGPDMDSYLNIVTPMTEELVKESIGEVSDAMSIWPRITSELLQSLAIIDPINPTGRSLSYQEMVQGDFNFVHKIVVGERTGFQFVHPGISGTEHKTTLLPNADDTWFMVSWDTRFSNPFDLVLSTFKFLR